MSPSWPADAGRRCFTMRRSSGRGTSCAPPVVSLGLIRRGRVLEPGPVPPGWRPLVKLLGGVVPYNTGTVARTFSVSEGGRTQVWVRGGTRAQTTVRIDGRRLASLRHE